MCDASGITGYDKRRSELSRMHLNPLEKGHNQSRVIALLYNPLLLNLLAELECSLDDDDDDDDDGGTGGMVEEEESPTEPLFWSFKTAPAGGAGAVSFSPSFSFPPSFDFFRSLSSLSSLASAFLSPSPSPKLVLTSLNVSPKTP